MVRGCLSFKICNGYCFEVWIEAFGSRWRTRLGILNVPNSVTKEQRWWQEFCIKSVNLKTVQVPSSFFFIVAVYAVHCTHEVRIWLSLIQSEHAIPFPPWMATASTPFRRRYSWISSTSDFFSAKIKTWKRTTPDREYYGRLSRFLDSFTRWRQSVRW